MARLRRAALILATALAAPLAGAPPAQADPTVLLAGFADFSAAATRLDFEGLGLVNGDDVASVGGVGFALSAGGPAKYYDESFPSEAGIPGAGSLNNFWGFVKPFPDLDVSLPGPMHRVAFEARVNAADQLAVTLLAGGAVVDSVVVPSRGSDKLYFYGFENATPFDQVRVDAVAGPSGAFTLDNLAFESLDAAPPEDPGDPGTPEDPGDPGTPEDPGDPGTPEDPGDPDPEPPSGPLALSCDGFDSFPRARRGHHRLRPRALLAKLTDAEGDELTSEDLIFPPVVRVTFVPHAGGPSRDVSDEAVAGTGHFGFVAGRVQRWAVWLKPWRMRAAGVYLATMESADPGSYTIDPTCADWTLSPPKRLHKKKHHHHRHHGGHRRD